MYSKRITLTRSPTSLSWSGFMSERRQFPMSCKWDAQRPMTPARCETMFYWGVQIKYFLKIICQFYYMPLNWSIFYQSGFWFGLVEHPNLSWWSREWGRSVRHTLTPVSQSACLYSRLHTAAIKIISANFNFHAVKLPSREVNFFRNPLNFSNRKILSENSH